MNVTASALLLAGGAFSATSQLMGAHYQAKATKRQAEYNAEVYEQQAEMIKEEKRIKDYQFRRQASAIRGRIVAATAGKGLMLSGSPLAVLADTETELLFDKAIQDYNLDVKRHYAESGADYYRMSGEIQARVARYMGYTNAFTTLLTTGYAAYQMRPATSSMLGRGKMPSPSQRAPASYVRGRY